MFKQVVTYLKDDIINDDIIRNNVSMAVIVKLGLENPGSLSEGDHGGSRKRQREHLNRLEWPLFYQL